MARTLRTALLLTLLLPVSAGAARAQFHGHTGGLQIHHAWVRATPPGVSMTAMYGTIVNPGDTPARLVGVTSKLAEAAEIHEVVQQGGMLHMQPVRGGVAIPAHGEFHLEPGGYHVMLIGLHAPLKPGDTVPLAFRFEDGREVELLAVANAGPGGMHGGHHHGPGGMHGEPPHGPGGMHGEPPPAAPSTR